MKFILAFTGIFLLQQSFAQHLSDNDSARYYLDIGQYARALPLAKKSLEVAKDNCNEDTAYISAASLLATIHTGLARFDSALFYNLKASEAAKKRGDDTSILYGIIQTNLGTVYLQLGQYQEAGQQFQYAATILNKEDSSYKSAYTYCLIQQVDFYTTTGRLNKAEELCLIALKTAFSRPISTRTCISALISQGRLYEKMGFYSKLEETLVRIFEMSKKVYGEKHPRYAAALGGLAHMYELKQNLKKADSLYRAALEIDNQTMGKNAGANVALLRHIAIVNTAMKKYKVAEKYLEKVRQIVYKDGGEESPLFQMYIGNLARLYALSGRKALAGPLFQKSLALYNKRGLIMHSARQNLLYDMASLLYDDNPAKAAIYLREAMAVENKLLLEKLDFLSETELLVYLKSNNDFFDNPYRFLLRHKNPAIAVGAYNSRLLASGIGLQNTKVLYQNMAQSKDSVLTMLWKSYLKHKSFYSSLLSMPVAKRNVNTDSVAASLNQQEKDILRRSADYRDMKEKLAFQWQDVQKHLQPKEAAIEFVRFNGEPNSYSGANNSTVYYAALLLRPRDTVPQFVALCKEKQLIAAMKKFSWKAAVLNRGGNEISAYAQNATSTLYKLIWQPLEPYLTNCKKIFFSPDGLLYQLAFAAIPYKKDLLLCNKYNLVQVTSTRQVAMKQIVIQAPSSIALFGGINYNKQQHDSTASVNIDPYAYVYQQNRGTGLDSFTYLPNTLTEVQVIEKNMEAKHKQVSFYIGDEATEAAFRNIGGPSSPTVIHFATHGFTLPDDTSKKNAGNNVFKVSDNPLLRSGLVMAGGNKGWQGKANANEDDGILTALEISLVPLPNTQLAVLSACETGVGELRGSEGLFGLQRAFKLAGVNYIMASLWAVPDKETEIFMQQFYNFWLSGKSIQDAFLNTQRSMQKKYPPYYWSAFTLVH